MQKVYFVGAGPGDPELITVKGRRLLDEADVVVYAGSLVNPKLLDGLKAKVYDSSSLNLDETTQILVDAIKSGLMAVRLHTGDTSFYSAITEQIERLRLHEIDYEVVPGVSSATAGAALLGQELTIPEVSQTVIFTRLEGRTPVPETERLNSLAKHKCTMVIFLSVAMIDRVCDELLQGGYQPETEVVVIEKATWPEQRVVRGTISNIAKIVRDAGIKKTALIYVGDALKASRVPMDKQSRLYAPGFSHGYRSATRP